MTDRCHEDDVRTAPGARNECAPLLVSRKSAPIHCLLTDILLREFHVRPSSLNFHVLFFESLELLAIYKLVT